ncbi:MAG TPA: FimV/HubP family polar landmark protein [Steroidobacteraceae bacterium]
MRRYLPRLVLAGALLSPATLYALGLGEIRLHSALNQPFDAEIELISPSPDELSSLKVGLAGADMFARYDIDRPAFLNNFEFEVRRGRDGRPVIHVSSNRSVTEPFVTMLVEARWARGRLLREYTVLLDPPVFMPAESQAQAPVTTPEAGAQSGRIERAPEPAPAPTPAPDPQVQDEPEPAAASSTQASEEEELTPASIGGEYVVERNDTLWSIASRITPGGPRTINRTMIALFRANPAAFNGNINRLRSGAVLRIPDLAEIEAIPTAEANAEVARQAAEWSGAQETQVAEESSRLRLVTPAETPTAPSAASTPSEPSTEPAATAAAPAAPTGTQDDRLAVPSPGLAEAQQAVAEAPVEPAPEAQPAPEEAVAEQPVAEQTEAEASPQPAAEAPAAQAPVQRPPARPPVEEPPAPSLMERIGQFWWVLVVLGLLLVVGLVLTVIRRRREGSAAASLDSLSSLNFEPRSERATPSFGAAAAKAPSEPEPFLDSEDEEEEASFEEPPAPVRRPEPAPAPRAEPAPAPAAASKASDDTLSSETAVRFDQQDALAEADFHMAYGLYDQAADLVKIAIEREPARRDLKLKLLEIYFVWGNKDLFLETARELHSTRSEAQAGEWDKVLIMGRQIAPEDPLFQGQAGPAHVDLVDVNLEGGENRVDVDLFAEPEADKPAGLDLNLATGEHPAASGASDGDLDFLLDEPGRGVDEEPTREMDQLARTQETPTIETPMIDRTSQTIREPVDRGAMQKVSGDQTAELALDDLGLDVDSLENTGSLEDTTSLKSDDDTGRQGREIGDDEMTQLAPSLGAFDRPKLATSASSEPIDIESTGTIYLDQVDLAGGDTVEQPRPDVESTASLKGPSQASDLDLDFDQLPSGNGAGSGGELGVDTFSNEVFADRTAEVPRVDLDVGEPLGGDDQEPTNRQQTVETEMELSELEPVTLSEVGTKLDLARAYMDMGDPDGARSILEEVLAEGNASQKQEAQRLIESIR